MPTYASQQCASHTSHAVRAYIADRRRSLLRNPLPASTAVMSSPRSSPVTTAVRTHIALLIVVGCLATCVAGSCLQYGHSCWGAHGKRSGRLEPRWITSPQIERSMQRPDQWYPQRQLDTSDDNSVVMPADSAVDADDITASDDKEILLMEPPRLFRILNQLPGKLELKAAERK